MKNFLGNYVALFENSGVLPSICISTPPFYLTERLLGKLCADQRPPGNSQAFNCHLCPGVKILTLGRVRKTGTGNVESLQRNTHVWPTHSYARKHKLNHFVAMFSQFSPTTILGDVFDCLCQCNCQALPELRG